MFKHAYLIVSNGNFGVVETCLKMIDDKRNDVYLLLDLKAQISDEQKQRYRQCVKTSKISICEKKVNWGGYSQISAVLTLMQMAMDSGEIYSYFHFLQGSDMPIRTQNAIHSFFEKNNGKEFVQIERSRERLAQKKGWYRHFFCHNRFFRKNRIVKLFNFSLVEIQRILKIRKNTDIELYQGSALFSVTGNCVKYILLKKKEIYRRFRYALAADEVFMQTMLMASPFKSAIYDVECKNSENARLIDRTRPDGKNSPHIWRYEDLDTILQAPDTKMFARKFDERTDFRIVETIFNEVCYCEQTDGSRRAE